MSSARDFLSKEQQEAILHAIELAEHQTSGEIRVHIESTCKSDPYERAQKVFLKLKMNKTAQRNGILFYLATKDRKFALVGDSGIHAVVTNEFWNNVKDVVLESFKEGNFAGGLTLGIEKAGEQLKKYFPYTQDDVNELSDEISFGK